MTMQNEQGVPEDVRKLAKERVAVILARFGINDAHIQSIGLCEDEIARAILADRASRTANMETCRREALEEAAKAIEKYAGLPAPASDGWGTVVVGSYSPVQAAAAIRALASKEEGR